MKIKMVILVVFLTASMLNNPVHPGELSSENYRKLDAKLSFLIDHPEMKSLLYTQMAGLKPSQNISKINVLIKTDLNRSALNKFGIQVHGQIGDIVTATLTMDQIQGIVAHPQISYIQGPGTVSIHNDVSTSEIKAVQTRQQYSLTGKGIIIGIIDTGIDWRHADFRNPDGTTRILAILDFSDPGDSDGDGDLDGPDRFGGTLHTEQEINNALNGYGTVSEKDVVGHGTHVAGSAAGNGRATGNGVAAGTYVGVAPEADLIIVKATRVNGIYFDPFDFTNGLIFIDEFATSLNKPYVINLSLGGQIGPHDGKDLSEQAIDNLLTGQSAKGHAVVVSAGNDGNQSIHASGTFSGSQTNIETKFDVPSYTPNSETSDDYVVFEGWYDGNSNYSIKVTSPSGESVGPVNSGKESARDTQDGAIVVDNAKGGAEAINGDKQFIIQIFDNTKTKPPKNGTWKINISGSSGRFDLWLSGSTMNASISSNLDTEMTIGTPGTAFKAITVGAYITKTRWTDLNGNILQNPNLVLNNASGFSSQGPTRDNRLKPEIAAPGELIAASYSADAPPTGEYSIFKSSYTQWPNAYIARDGKHGLSQGTSFAAPHVAGAIALMLQKSPDKTPDEIKQAITTTARTDNFTGSVPNQTWGYGKLDVLSAFQIVSVSDPRVETLVPKSVELYQNYPNPFNPTTIIPYSIDKTMDVKISVFNLLGQNIKTLFSGVQLQGLYRIQWDGTDDSGNAVPSGIYFFRLDAGEFSSVKKMILLP